MKNLPLRSLTSPLPRRDIVAQAIDTLKPRLQAELAVGGDDRIGYAHRQSDRAGSTVSQARRRHPRVPSHPADSSSWKYRLAPVHLE